MQNATKMTIFDDAFNHLNTVKVAHKSIVTVNEQTENKVETICQITM